MPRASFLSSAALFLGAFALNASADQSTSTSQPQQRSNATPVHAFVPCKRPEYPEQSRRNGSEGQTIIEFVVTGLGFVIEARVFQSSGDPFLDHASLLAVVGCRGARFGSASEGLRMKVTYTWKLSD